MLTVVLFVVVQLAGAIAGAWLANGMFGLPLLQFSAQGDERENGNEEQSQWPRQPFPRRKHLLS